MKKIVIQKGTIISNWQFVEDTPVRERGNAVGVWLCLLCNREFTVTNTSVLRKKSKRCVDCGHLSRKKPQHLLCLDRKRKAGIPLLIDEKVAYAEYRKQQKARSKLSLRGRAGELLRNAAKSSRTHGYEFTLTNDWVVEKLKVGRCEATDVQLELGPPQSGHFNWNAPSLDRIDSSKGYTADNVQLTTWRYNCCKREMSRPEFEEFCRLVWESAKGLTSPKIVRL